MCALTRETVVGKIKENSNSIKDKFRELKLIEYDCTRGIVELLVLKD